MTKCGRCKLNPRRAYNMRYCLPCHNAYMRQWRKTHPLTPAQKTKDSARSYLNEYIKRGKIKRLPCNVCGIDPAEGHHIDYSKPLDVIWLCRIHHLDLHLSRPIMKPDNLRYEENKVKS